MCKQRVVWSWLLAGVLSGGVGCNDDNGINPFAHDDDEESHSPATEPDSGRPIGQDAAVMYDASVPHDAGSQQDAGKPQDGGKAHPDAGPSMLVDAGEDSGWTQPTPDAGEDAGLDAGQDANVEVDEDAGFDPNTPPPLEINGAWHSNFGGTELIASDSWASYGYVEVIDYDNEHNTAVTQNADDDAYYPSKFNKIVWTEVGSEGFYYCIVEYGLDSADAARESAATADATDLASGCSGFSWTNLSPVIEIGGVWKNNFGGTDTIDSDAWTSYSTSTVIEYDNEHNTAITQNPDDDAYNPSKFNKVVWTEISDEQLYYCIVDYALDTADAARNSVMTADANDPETSGCGGFSWTRLDAE